MDKLVLGWMYPDLFNLHGERGSVQALLRAGENLGAEVELRRIEDPDDDIPFDELDMMIFLPGEIKSFPMVRQALEARREALDAFIENGKYLIALGTTGLLFGRSVEREDGTVLPGLGYLDMTAKERKYVWADDLHFHLNDTKQEIIGCHVMMADIEAAAPLGTILFGRGNNGTGAEGARYKNLIYTNCVGPVFVRNPWWAEDIIKDVCLRKFLGLERKKDHALASASLETTLRFIEKKPKIEGE